MAAMKLDLREKPVLLTGASGFLGQALVRQLIADGCTVTAVSRSQAATSAPGWIGLAQYEDAHTLLPGHSCVVHLAARVHVMHDTSADPLTEFRAANVDVTLNLARQAAAAGVQRFVFISSVKVNGESTAPARPFSEVDPANPQDAYGQSKCEAEQGLRQISADTGLEVVIIRPPLVYGPGVKANFSMLMRAVQRGCPLPLGAITYNRRSLVGLDNLVDLIVACITHPAAANQTFLAGDGQDLSTADLVRGLARAAGVPARLIPVPVWALQAVAILLGKKDAAQRLCGSLQVDISKAQALLGWVPPVSVDEGLRRAFAKMGKS
jgi:nucleoside-diphosphate-sugar epimerase